ncbi:hypothetical protein HPB48_000496 [Haemaphysalis longicornis]|uniref:Potassium channel inwardly rectifying transmembrane domain-containing protein n=1 Tax=Haemaphysalis longicornis TaxID=44386 RepID=A0A9J6FH67_HAELO|nr:hypothetical protein HPB48_000496 [Haemaphysalis longicornis]
MSAVKRIGRAVAEAARTGGAMKFVEMENGQAWQQLISRGHGVHASGGGVAGDSDYEAPSNQASASGESSTSSRRILTKHLSLNGFPRCADPSSNGANGAEDSPVVRYQKAKIIPSRVRKRVIFKNGSVNLSKEHVYKRSQRYLQDIFTTLVRARSW